MLMVRAVCAIALVLAACESSSPAPPPTPSGSGSAKPAAKTGFSADMAKELGNAGSAEPAPAPAPAPAPTASAPAPAPAAPSKPAATPTPTPPPPPPPTPTPTPTPTAAPAAPVKPPANPLPESVTARVAVKPSAELAAIKLSLLPNWERDVGEAGTISFPLKVPGKSDVKVFVFHYGYEQANAPGDREQYKKWLGENKILSVGLDRQRSSAWYLEGVDGNGQPAFRMLVIYGGKKLVCGGPLYKDPGSNALGDLRDQTIIQAKQICETLAL